MKQAGTKIVVSGETTVWTATTAARAAIRGQVGFLRTAARSRSANGKSANRIWTSRISPSTTASWVPSRKSTFRPKR